MTHLQAGETPIEIDVFDLHRMLDEAKPPHLLDCREADEYALVHLNGAQHIPMQELPDRLSELGENRQQHVVVYCHHGARSLRVAQWLRQQGWSQVQSVEGGIDAWSEHVDRSKPRY